MAYQRLRTLISALIMWLVVVDAHAAGLTRAHGILKSFESELKTLTPIIAIIALILVGMGYAMRLVEKDTFIRWAMGIIIAGSAGEITLLFFR